jgi:hypothetical protein
MNTSIVILGSGYTGKFLAPILTTTSRPFLATSRSPQKKLTYLPESKRLHFDLAQQRMWPQIPVNADILWCFPAVPMELVREFAEAASLSTRRLVVMGSTSAYDVGNSADYPPPWIDESAPIDLTKPRVQGEEFLRKEWGAIVLRVAGIYGPGRNPIDWIKTGRVSPSRKYVNLIHVEDLATICLAALERGRPGEVYNVSDGQPRTWEEIYRQAGEPGADLRTVPAAHQASGKRISNAKLMTVLGIKLRHPDLYSSVTGC